VLTTPLKISQSLLTRYQEAVGDLYCPDDDGKDKEDEAEQLAVANGTFFTLPPKNKSEPPISSHVAAQQHGMLCPGQFALLHDAACLHRLACTCHMTVMFCSCCPCFLCVAWSTAASM
jgi:hypothetical protein